MLVDFGLSSYRSYNKEMVISLRAGDVSENVDTIRDGLLPLLGIFGYDGSGRESVLTALEGVISLISLPLLFPRSEILSRLYLPYRSSDKAPSFFLTSKGKNGIYRYSISIGSSEIITEKLEKAVSLDGKFSVLYERTPESVSYHGGFRTIGAFDVPQDIPLLSLLYSEHSENEAVSDSYSSIADGFLFSSNAISFDSLNQEKAELVLGILNELSFDIKRIITRNDTLYLSYSEDGFTVPLSEESCGIKELLRILPSVVTALSEGKVLVLPAFLSSLHPLIQEYVLHLFSSRESNGENAQLVFTSSSFQIMDVRNLRRDEIYLAEKREDGSKLYSISSIKNDDGTSVRKDARLQKRYWEGDFGALPEIRKLISWNRKTDKKSRDDKKFFHINNRRYLGNKFRITGFIREIADKHCPDASVFADIFSGTGSVSYAFRDKKLILNDFLYSNYLTNLAWFSSEHFEADKVSALIDKYNAAECNEENYFSENFSNTYFSESNCRKIGWIREDIESLYRKGEINMREKAILVTSLMYAMDRIAATCGHYDAWRERADLSEPLCLRMLDADNSNNDNEIYTEDTNELVKHIEADIVYIDPPYNSRQYSDSYHLLENVARWEKPEVAGKARKMDRKNIKSLYSTNKAASAMRDLIGNIKARYILLSYNNMEDKGDGRSNAKISDEEILEMLAEKGDVSVFSVPHKAFTAGKSHIEGNEERVFLCRVRDRKKKSTSDDYIASPLNYVGGKGRIIHELLDAFPKEMDTFVDLFSGGCTVGVNVPARKVIFNDSDSRLVSLLREMRSSDKERFISDVFAVIGKYGLSRSDIHGYEYYGADSSRGLGDVNREGYLRLRDDFNTEALDGHMKAVMLYVLVVYAFNNQIRFNDDGYFNLPVGKRDFNLRMQEKLSVFIDRIKTMDSVFLDSDFRTVEIPDGSFVYADPPYLITTATYNEKHGWTENDETSLHEILENLTERGIKFALSNTLKSRGKENTFLLSWIERHPEYRILHIDRSYSNSNYHIKDKDAETDEVLILNY